MTYYYKDKDQNHRLIYRLMRDGQQVGIVRTHKEAETWFKSQ